MRSSVSGSSGAEVFVVDELSAVRSIRNGD